MPDERQDGLLLDILESARCIQRYLTEVKREGFLANQEKQDAVLRRFEIIGEAASRVSPETQGSFPTVPFRSMRNIIAHDYGDVDLDQVWKTATDDLPGLVEILERHFA